MPDFIQSQIRYIFKDEQLVNSAFKTAHRNRNDELLDDGNRGLAHYGTLAISIVETHNAIVESGTTLHDFNKKNHWSKTKKGRAAACRALGFEPFITQSVRQQHQCASDTVLDNAFSAMIGAVWLDCEAQEKTVAETRRTVWKVLRDIDAFLESSPSASSENCALQIIDQGQNIMFEHSVDQSGLTGSILEEEQDDMEKFAAEWCAQAFGDLPFGQVSHEEDFLEPPGLLFQASREVDHAVLPEDHLVDEFGGRSSNLIAQNDPAACAGISAESERVANKGHCSVQGQEALRIADGNATMRATSAKRKRAHPSKERVNSTYDRMLDAEKHKLAWVPPHEQEKLAKFLDHPDIEKLGNKSSVLFPFLYLAIGSWQTVADFKSQLSLARKLPRVYQQSGISNWSAAETYKEICRLETEEALSVLLRRYHTIKLCANEENRHRQGSHIIVEVSGANGVAAKSNAGNPIVALDAILTDQLLYKIMPEVQSGTNEFMKARRRVKRLRRLARCLRTLVQYYGIGILALLPSGPSFEGFSLTDNMLISLTESSFNQFAQLLFQEQGSLLKSVSQYVEPSLLALSTCSLDNGAVYPVECLDISWLSSIPKGLLNLGHCPSALEQCSGVSL